MVASWAVMLSMGLGFVPSPVLAEPFTTWVELDALEVYSLEVDPRGMVYAGLLDRVIEYDGHDAHAVLVPRANRVLDLHREGERLYYAANGDFGYFEVSERYLGPPVSMVRRAPIDEPVLQRVLSTSDAVFFAASNGWLVRCPRPVTANSACTSFRVETRGYTIFSHRDDEVWVQVQGEGLLRWDGDGFDQVSTAEPFVVDRMPVDLPGRAPGERLLGFFRAGLYWWTEAGGLEPVRDEGPRLTNVYRGEQLPRGGYAIASRSMGLHLLNARGQTTERLDQDGPLRSPVVSHIAVNEAGWLLGAAGYRIFLLDTDPARREFRIEPPPGEVRQIRSTSRGDYVLSRQALYRLRPDASPAGRLEVVYASDSDDLFSFLEVDGSIFIGGYGGLHELRGAALHPVWGEDRVVFEVAQHPERPQRLVVGTLYGLSVLDRTDDGFRTVYETELSNLATDIGFDAAGDIWFRVSRDRVLRLSERSDGFELRDFTPPSPPGSPRPRYAELLATSTGVWGNLQSVGVHRFDFNAEAFQVDPSLGARLGVDGPTLVARPMNPEALLVEYPWPDPIQRVWVAEARPGERPADADWRELSPSTLGRALDLHIARAVVGGRFLVGGIGTIASLDWKALPEPQDPPAPLLRRVQTWSETSTTSRALPPYDPTLQPNERGLELAIATVTPDPERDIVYRSRVRELSERWSPWDAAHRRTFESLPFGTVHIDVQARDVTRRTSDVRTLVVQVRPPLHRTAAAMGAYALGMVGLVIFGLRAWTRALRERARRLQRELNERRKSEALARGQAELLGRTLEGISRRPELETYLNEVLQGLAELLRADRVLLWSAADGGDLWPRLSRPADAAWISEPPLPERPEPRLDGGVVWLPLWFEDGPLGLVAVFPEEPQAVGEAEQLVAQALATQVTLALKLSELAETQRDRAVLEERDALSREVHDSLAQGFVMTGLQLERVLASLSEVDGPALRALLDRALQLNRAGLAEARRCIRLLRTQRPSEGALPDLLHGLEARVRTFEIEFGFEVRGSPRALGPRVSFELYRIADEAVSNAIKHAGAARIDVRLTFEADTVRLVIDDDGKGLDPEDPGTGLGRASMRERARLIGAELRIHDRSDGPGVRVEVGLSTAELRA